MNPVHMSGCFFYIERQPPGRYVGQEYPAHFVIHRRGLPEKAGTELCVIAVIPRAVS